MNSEFGRKEVIVPYCMSIQPSYLTGGNGECLV